jgi:uncharacterized membrane protein SpoIIM required for sporulation
VLDKPSNTLNILEIFYFALSHSREITVSKYSVPIYAVAILAIIFALGLFVVGYDQGHIFSVVIGEQAYEDLYIHELMHDMRHAAGFPCH